LEKVAANSVAIRAVVVDVSPTTTLDTDMSTFHFI
jgi:hypothetical protein